MVAYGCISCSSNSISTGWNLNVPVQYSLFTTLPWYHLYIHIYKCMNIHFNFRRSCAASGGHPTAGNKVGGGGRWKDEIEALRFVSVGWDKRPEPHISLTAHTTWQLRFPPLLTLIKMDFFPFYPRKHARKRNTLTFTENITRRWS